MKLEEMAFDRKSIMDEAKAQFLPLLKHWALVRYAVKLNPECHFLDHWKDEVVAAIWNVGMMELKKGNRRDTVKKAINEMYYTNMQVQNKSYVRVFDKLQEKEHVTFDSSEFDTAFKADLPRIISAMASGDYDAAWNYVDSIR